MNIKNPIGIANGEKRFKKLARILIKLCGNISTEFKCLRMNKAVTRPNSLKVDFFNKFEYGLVFDVQNVRDDFLDIQKSANITFYTDNAKIGKMLNSKNIKKFKETTKDCKNQIDICKKRSSDRKITVTGENAYSVYLLVKGLLG